MSNMSVDVHGCKKVEIREIPRSDDSGSFATINFINDKNDMQRAIVYFNDINEIEKALDEAKAIIEKIRRECEANQAADCASDANS